YLLSFFLSAILAAVLGFVLGFLFSVMANRGMFPEYLKSPIILSAVLLCFVMAELIMNETGMLAVTVMGLTMGWARKNVSYIGNIYHFIVVVFVFFLYTVFILIMS